MGTGKNIRLIDIAKELGYTVNTVSRALRDKSDIGLATKNKVKETASSMGYIPNSIASSLRSGSTNTIAIVFDNMINPYFMIMADIIHNQLESIGYATMIFASHNTKFQIDSLNPIISRKVDGIITFLEPDKEVLDICLNQQIPIVLLGRKNTNLKINSVSTDDFLGGYEVGRLLVKKGARNIGYIGAPEEIECSVRRLNGLKASLNELKINYNEDNLRYLKNNNLKSELDVLLNNGVDAIFFFNDVMALEAITVLESKKIKVPNDIKIVGFDDIQSEFFIPIELTTVSSDKVKIVKTAVDLLILNIQERDLTKFNHIDFKVEVKLGNTV